mmetsp:Transcript_48008/g.154893  ORF Transcript_48008/g.154893 Transcript_48008/m.154893 type:complete len:267 (+) Transcript_48008:574-1374(+)
MKTARLRRSPSVGWESSCPSSSPPLRSPPPTSKAEPLFFLLFLLGLLQLLQLALHTRESFLQLLHHRVLLVKLLLLLVKPLLLALRRRGQKGDQVLVHNGLLILDFTIADGADNLWYHRLELVSDETEPHVLGLSTLAEGVGHRPELPQQPQSPVGTAVVTGALCGQPVLNLATLLLGLLSHLRDNVPERSLQRGDFPFQPPVRCGDGSLCVPRAMEDATITFDGQRLCALDIKEEVCSILLDVRRAVRSEVHGVHDPQLAAHGQF